MIKLFKFLKPYYLFISAILVLVFFQTMAQLYLPTLMADIVDIGIVKGDINYIVKVGFLMIFVAAVGAISSFLASYLTAKTGTGFSKILRNKVFSQVERFSLHEFDDIGTASLITRTTNDITQIQRVTIMILRMMISAPLMAIGGIIMAVSKDATLSLVVVIIVPILGAVIFLIARKATPLFKAIQVKIDKLNLVLRENLTGIRVIRAFNRISFEKKRFDQANLDLTNTSIKAARVMAAMMPVMMILFNFTTITVIWFGGIRIDNGFMQVGDLMAFIQYISQIMFSFIMLSMVFVMISRASASAERINEVLGVVPEIQDSVESKSTDNKKGFIEFRDVIFSYSGAEEPVIKNITFSASPGEVTAIIGSTGSGKSTLVNLIPRFYDVESGSVLIDGVDVRELTQQELRSKIGFVPQKALLFTGTIAENIRYGKEDANYEDVRPAAETAQAAEFITGMKDSYDSLIAQGGKNLSGGQKQRLAIARALIRKPEIYIFDDSFSALDFKTDVRLRRALKKETGDSTVIIVAQRVSTVMNSDRIIVLDNGEITGVGTHRELLNTCQVYREIVSSQLSEEELA